MGEQAEKSFVGFSCIDSSRCTLSPGVFLFNAEGSTSRVWSLTSLGKLIPLEGMSPELNKTIPAYAKISQTVPAEQSEAFFPIPGLVSGDTEWSEYTRNGWVPDGMPRLGTTVVTVSPNGQLFALRQRGTVYVLCADPRQQGVLEEPKMDVCASSWADGPKIITPKSSTSPMVVLALFVSDTILAVLTQYTSETGVHTYGGSLSAYHIDAGRGSITPQNNVPSSWASGVMSVAVPGTQWQYTCTNTTYLGRQNTLLWNVCTFLHVHQRINVLKVFSTGDGERFIDRARRQLIASTRVSHGSY